MAEESALKIECAKLQNNIHLMEDELSQLEGQLQRSQATNESGRKRMIAMERSKFEERKIAAKKAIEEACNIRRVGASDLVDSFPGIEKKEVAGKCEIESIEEKLATVYPQSLLDDYICVSPIEFDSDSEAYSAYVYVERKVAKLSAGSVSSTVFNGITSLLESISSGKLGGKAVLIALTVFTATFAVVPTLFIGLFTVIGVCSIIQGANANKILESLYSVKRYLNEVYDEDVFNEDKNDVLDKVDNFLSGVQDAYFQEIDEREFVMNPKLLSDYDAKVKADGEKLEAAIAAKRQAIDEARNRATQLVEQIDKLIAERENAAKQAKKDYLSSVDWKMEWFNNILLDVTSDLRVVGCRWTQGNTLYYSKNLEQLQQFEVLASYQTFLHVHPSFARQAALDYKYMGGLMVPFSRLQPNIFELCTDSESISKRLERIVNDMKARISNILQACPNIEEFNKMMATYGAPGESLVIVHIMGLSSFNTELLNLLKNGPKVGYFFKIYMTLEELSKVGTEFPFDDVAEYSEITDIATVRTVAQVRRRLEPSA